MRLSLLLQREPFGQILEETMSEHWSSEGADLKITWGKSEKCAQSWRGNIYLNFFCVDNVDSDCFEIIKREFSHSRKRSRRLLQAAYVQTAIRAPFRNILSQVQFSVSREVPLAHEQLLIGGNRRIRLIHPKAAKSIVIQKKGFSRLGFDREVTARSGLAAAVAPEFFGLDESGESFSEEYFVGTPSNRFPIDQQASYVGTARERLISEVHRPSLRTALISEYFGQLSDSLREFSEEFSTAIVLLERWFSEHVKGASLGLVFSHGDFQDANILANDEVLHIIDWENATERSQLYDLATMDSGMRQTADSVLAWRNQVEKWLFDVKTVPSLEVTIKGQNEILALAMIWWIEEMVFQLEEGQASSFANFNDVIVKQNADLDGVLKLLIALS
ncbi:phosphotransferase [Akkermansiaceae bacterium]|nr:phosphotransferase [Akkermansiaceae bacterium]